MTSRLLRRTIQFGIPILLAAGLLAAVIPRFLHQYGRSLAKHSLGGLHTIGSALEAYRSKHGAFPACSGRQPVQVLESSLVPEFLPQLPKTDVWAHPYLVATTPTHYEVWSLGADGVAGPNDFDGPTDDLNSDILFSDGRFARYPRGLIGQ